MEKKPEVTRAINRLPFHVLLKVSGISLHVTLLESATRHINADKTPTIINIAGMTGIRITSPVEDPVSKILKTGQRPPMTTTNIERFPTIRDPRLSHASKKAFFRARKNIAVIPQFSLIIPFRFHRAARYTRGVSAAATIHFRIYVDMAICQNSVAGMIPAKAIVTNINVSMA